MLVFFLYYYFYLLCFHYIELNTMPDYGSAGLSNIDIINILIFQCALLASATHIFFYFFFCDLTIDCFNHEKKKTKKTKKKKTGIVIRFVCT